MTPLERAARYGPYFAWEQYGGDPSWLPGRELGDQDVLAERVEDARQTLMAMSGLSREAIGEREVASTVFLGMAARLLSPLLAAAAEDTPVQARLTDLWWRPAKGGLMPIAYRRLNVAFSFEWTVVGPLIGAFRRRFGLSRQVLLGNVSSALGGALGMIADAGGPADRAADVVRDALQRAPLRGTAALHRPDPAAARCFLVRNNCCLYYRIPGGGTCGDCILTPAAERERTWAAVLAKG